MIRPRTASALALGLLLPFLVCLALYPARHSIENTDAALVLVAVVVAVATFGVRIAGLLAALSAGISYDLLLTVPYGSLSIHSRQDVDTVLLLVVVGLAVTEIAAQGWRQRRRVEQQADYLDRLQRTVAAVASADDPRRLIEQVRRTLISVLLLQSCEFEPSAADELPEITGEGEVRWGDVRWDVAREGLPLQTETALPVRSAHQLHGRYLLRPQLDARPSRLQLLLAVSLAGQVGAALAARSAGS
ncbi:MAG TPA: DUF4118 domain-containing protein [Jatrophihabitans sp.]|nr:DUF4118 domain-containing protein [Jatrophihabitans sp.]